TLSRRGAQLTLTRERTLSGRTKTGAEARSTTGMRTAAASRSARGTVCTAACPSLRGRDRATTRKRSARIRLPATSGDELATRGGSSGVHVAAPVEMVVDLCRRAHHAAEEEDRERRRLQLLLGDSSGLVVRPQQRQEHGRDHPVDIDAEDVGRGTYVEKRLHQLPVVVVKDVVLAALSHC